MKIRQKSGAPVRLPPAEMAKFRFRMDEPFGKEALVAVASPKQFTDIQTTEWIGREVFPGFSDIRFRSMLTRGLYLEADPGPSGPEGVTEPATTEPATTEPATTEPATTEPATTEPATTEPATAGQTDPTNLDGANLIAKPSWARLIYAVESSSP